jgi:competence ComEA-like helix-hairpin-helix protein
MLGQLRSIVLLLAACLLICPLGSANKKPPPAPVNLNTATSAQLQQVPGIGPSTADKIVQMRKSYGPFRSVNDLLAIRGMGPKKLEKMRKYLVAGKSVPKNPATSTVKSPPSTGSTAKKPPPATSAKNSTAAKSLTGAKPSTAAKTSTAKTSPAPAAPIAKAKPEVSDEEPQ